MTFLDVFHAIECCLSGILTMMRPLAAAILDRRMSDSWIFWSSDMTWRSKMMISKINRFCWGRRLTRSRFLMIFVSCWSSYWSYWSTCTWMQGKQRHVCTVKDPADCSWWPWWQVQGWWQIRTEWSENWERPASNLTLQTSMWPVCDSMSYPCITHVPSPLQNPAASMLFTRFSILATRQADVDGFH